VADETLAFNILARDHASSAFDKVARSADRTAASLKKSAAINDAVAKAEARLSKARDGESDALGRVRVAETRLTEIRGNSNAKTSQIQQAEEALSSARRKAAQSSNTAVMAERELSKARTRLAADAASVGRDSGHSFGKSFGDGLDKEGGKSTKRFGATLRHWLTGAGKDFEKAGRTSGDLFSSGLSGTLKTPVVGPIVAAALIAAVEAAAIPAGALLGTGIVTGFGAGIAGLGLKFAAESERVKKVWAQTSTAIGAQMRTFAAPLEDSLIRASAVAQRTFAKFAPQLKSAFAGLAPVISSFVDTAGRALERFAPAIEPLTTAFGAVLRTLGPALNDAIGKVSLGLQALARSVQKSPDALADLVRGAGDLTSDLISMIKVLNDANGAFKRLTGISGVTAVFEGLRIAVSVTVGPIIALAGGLGKAADLLGKGLDSIGLKSRRAGMNTQQLASSIFEAVRGVQALIPVYSGAAAATNEANRASRALAAQFDRQWAATQRSNEALTRMSGLLLTLSGSQIAYQQAIDDATASIKENGKTHDINTAKGRANKTALDQVAASAQAQTVAMRNAGDGNVAAAKHAEGARANFVKLAVQMGYSKTEAEKLAGKLIAIPNVSRTAKLNANKKDLETKLAAAKRQLADKDLTKERRAQLNATIAKLEAGIRRAKELLAGVPASKTVTITSRMITERIIRTQTTAITGGHASGFASGGLIPGRPSNVDNHVRPMATGEFVVQADKVRGNLATLNAINEGKRPAPYAQGRSSGAGVNLTINVNGAQDPYATADAIVRTLRKYVRINGGDVQAVFGR
jgi:hypothetical protein